MRVLVIINNPRQASYRLRIASLAPLMAQLGFDWEIQVRPRSILARRRMIRGADAFDAVILQRKMLDPSDMRLLRSRSQKLFFDVDDAVMFHNRPVSRLEQWRTTRRFGATAANVDKVVAGNQYLAKLFADAGAKTLVLPTMVDASHYRVKTHGPADGVQLVWIGSKSTLPYLAGISNILSAAASRIAGLRLRVIADQKLPAPHPLGVEHAMWSEATESEQLCLGDIGIAPTPTDRWTLGKCGFKIVQYMAAGLPVIASPVGANAELVELGVSGFLPQSDEQWLEAITKLAADPALRGRMGQAGRQRVLQRYTIEKAADFWANLLRAL